VASGSAVSCAAGGSTSGIGAVEGRGDPARFAPNISPGDLADTIGALEARIEVLKAEARV
jgi:hypothetical protein